MKALPLAFLLLALGGSQASAGTGQTKSDPVTRWEYRVLNKQQLLELGNNDFAAGLNKVGDDGWELAVVDGAYIFKRPRSPAAELKRRLTEAQVDVEQCRDRAAWAERMAKKGLLSNQQAEADKAKLRTAELVLEQARRDLELLPADVKKGSERDSPPKK
jgi:hypothetical protein